MRPDSAVVFADKAQVYGTYRPEHPEQVIEILRSRLAPGSIVADIGAGTGRLSQRLAQAGFVVKLIEPNAQMRSIAAERVRSLGDDAVTVLAAEAQRTQLAACSVDLVIAATSAHWFLDDLPATLTEFKRILKPDGLLAILYTMMNESSPMTQALDAMLSQHYPAYCHGTIGFMNHQRFDSPNLPTGVAAHYIAPPIEIITHCFEMSYTWDDFERLLRTYSFFPSEAAAAETMTARLKVIFDRFVAHQKTVGKEPVVTIDWSTHLQLGQPKSIERAAQ